jgi:hypothetical protein
MTMLSAEDLKRMREVQHEALPDTVTIKRRVAADDGFGGTTAASTITVAEDVACRYFPGQMEEIFGQHSTNIERNVYTFRFKLDTDVKDKDTLELSDGTTFKVERLKSPKSWHQIMTVVAERYTA